ncbi:anti-sigma F factor [Alicyclobacillus acidoterrestris]|uniref:anti-sigma F factor n=1 Tax=Alicyclobacillus acidoterrestris TaxID=1450 RepID=UPI0003865430|nr:anti-sigma F factor [Alicyclobacillus acidoterrestris]EPZ48909.1 serine/threonine protein kinase [Alicyclobacillus acidoterrestris ATCC 49025]
MERIASQVQVNNYLRLQFPSRSENESLARVAVASFVAQLDPTMEELTELKTAVSEAVTNAIIHGYEDRDGEVRIECALTDNTVTIVIEDEGVGIPDVEEARQPMYTSRPELERSGMGMTIMESFVDSLEVESTVGRGTRVTMIKTFGADRVQM